MSANFETLYTFDTTPSTADCVEWCPVQEAQDYVVCGTYHLVDKEKQIKQGKLFVFKCSEE